MRLLWMAVATLVVATSYAPGQNAAHSIIPEKIGLTNYPPIAKAARVSGDVVVRFTILPQGTTRDVTAVEGPRLLRQRAEEVVRSWEYSPAALKQTRKITFHFRTEEHRYDDEGPKDVLVFDKQGNPTLKAIVANSHRSGCPPGGEAVPEAVIKDDYVELSREACMGSCPVYSVKVSADGQVRWDGRFAVTALKTREAEIPVKEALRLLERFRSPEVWNACKDYTRDVTDSARTALEVRIDGVTKKIGEYADSAPDSIHDVETLVDEIADTHRWRVGDPKQESMADIFSDLWLPKPGKTKLMVAVLDGKVGLMNEAMSAGGKVTDVDASGWTPLMYASAGYSESGVRFLLNKGANVNVRGPRGETALMFHAVTGWAGEDLIQAGADVNATNEDGVTALMLVAQRGEPLGIGALLKAGAKATAKDRQGRTAMDYLMAANCGVEIIRKRPFSGMGSYEKCTAISREDLKASTRLLQEAGAKQTRPWSSAAISGSAK